ncbi:hypothetical protein C8D96_1551 [Kushneria marisflavi]|nr:hypothetical protein C8D96_1551 [Kushneria marisflavi]
MIFYYILLTLRISFLLLNEYINPELPVLQIKIMKHLIS